MFNLKVPTSLWTFVNDHHSVCGFTPLQQRIQEVLQAVGNAAHHVAGVAILGKKKGKLKIRVLLQLDLPSVAPRQLISCVFCYCHHVVYELLQIWTQHARQSDTRLTGNNNLEINGHVYLTGGM